jgi:predicted small lipoprotein YifL
MKNWFILILVAFSLAGCGQKSHDHPPEEVGDALESGGNQALYDEVMKIHDEVMPRMDEIYRKKESLKNRIADTPGMIESDKSAIEDSITRLDQASEGMMVWMREFNPIPDSLGEEKAREYLENEMEKIKKVREDIIEVLGPKN